jgi:peroxiredoxin Q/BCP
MSAVTFKETTKSETVSIGRKAPDFTLRTDRGEKWNLSDNIGSVTVLLFYPQNETMVCTRQLCSLRENWHQYLDTKATIVGISPGSPAGNRLFSEKLSLPITLLADPDRKVTKYYGKHWLYPISFTRAVVVIDSRGIVRNSDIMLRAFRPSDANLITDIYAARGDELHDTIDNLRKRAATAIYK